MALTNKIGNVDAQPSNIQLGGSGTSSNQPEYPSRVTQVVAELGLNESATARISHTIAELTVGPTATARVSHVIAELVLPVIIPSRISQVVAELVDAGVRDSRVTQTIAEVIGAMPNYCGDPSVSFAEICGKEDLSAWIEWTLPRRES